MTLVNPQHQLGKLSLISKNRWIDAGRPGLDIFPGSLKKDLEYLKGQIQFCWEISQQRHCCPKTIKIKNGVRPYDSW